MWTERRSGQTNQRGTRDHRTPYERDKTRVIHCPAFRRLQRKTQILDTNTGDFHRTRMTHSLEVASIGASIVRHLNLQQNTSRLNQLLPEDDLINVICLLHDIGHPPFGHGGETALNYMMREHGGFEGNAQTLRLVTKGENSYSQFGLDLTRRALLGILKYPISWSQALKLTNDDSNTASTQQENSSTKCPQRSIHRVNDWPPPKAYFDSEQPDVDWLLSPFTPDDRQLFQSMTKQPGIKNHGCAAYHTFDCSIMDIADDIAYGVHDLEDAIHLRLIHRHNLDTPIFRKLLAATELAQHKNSLIADLFDSSIRVRKQAIGEMVNYFITATSIQIINTEFTHDLFKYNVVLLPQAQDLLAKLMECVYEHVIDSQEARILEHAGQTIILHLFDAINSNPNRLLDKKNRELFSQSENANSAYRVICDVIANMTDEHASSMHSKLMGIN